MIKIYDIWFSNLEISNSVKLKLLEEFETTENIWKLKRIELEESKINEKNIFKILDVKYRLGLDKYVKVMEKNNIELILCNDKRYPLSLNEIDDKPVCLYVRGNLGNLYEDCIAIVGSREASEYGKSVARRFAKEIADRNVNVVSGLARGIDKYAHLGALESCIGKTIAVLGTGVLNEDIYPLQNKKVFERILESGGTIISEFKLGTKPERYNFPYRNRIISGLSKKVLVVESSEKSGSLITANYALEQGKDVFAVPGNITSDKSLGTNKLIFEGANIARNVEDIFLL